MKSKQMTTQTPQPKGILIQFRVPDSVAYKLRVAAAKQNFSTLAKYMKHLSAEIAAKQ